MFARVLFWVFCALFWHLVWCSLASLAVLGHNRSSVSVMPPFGFAVLASGSLAARRKPCFLVGVAFINVSPFLFGGC